MNEDVDHVLEKRNVSEKLNERKYKKYTTVKQRFKMTEKRDTAHGKTSTYPDASVVIVKL